MQYIDQLASFLSPNQQSATIRLRFWILLLVFSIKASILSCFLYTLLSKFFFWNFLLQYGIMGYNAPFAKLTKINDSNIYQICKLFHIVWCPLLVGWNLSSSCKHNATNATCLLLLPYFVSSLFFPAWYVVVERPRCSITLSYWSSNWSSL